MAKTRTWAAGDKTVVFMPFPRANSRDHLDSTLGRKKTVSLFGGPGFEITEEEGWNRYATDPFGRIKGIKFTDDDVVCADDPGLSAKLGELTKASDMLYIRGHCSAGSYYLTSSDRTVHVTEAAIVALLNGKLAKDFPGIIKVYACSSGLSSGWGFWTAFGQRLADEMWSAGYQQCKFYGYTASVSSYAEGKDFIGKQRKMAVGPDKRPLGTASTRRIEITPIEKEVLDAFKKALS